MFGFPGIPGIYSKIFSWVYRLNPLFKPFKSLRFSPSTAGWGLRETNTIRVLEKGQSCRDVGIPGAGADLVSG